MTPEQLAELIVDSIDRHGLRGLIYEADGAVVMHGKVDMVAVAKDVIDAMTAPEAHLHGGSHPPLAALRRAGRIGGDPPRELENERDPRPVAPHSVDS